MSLRQQLGSLRRRALCSLYRRTMPLGDAGPIVSFTFDDFPRSAYTVGGAVLEKFGARGTYYVTAGLMNVSNELGELFIAEDLDALVARGHELGTQTFHHSSGRALPLPKFVDDVQQGIRAMEKIKGNNAANFAYPYGHASFGSKRTLGPVLTSSRSIFPGVNGPEIDLNLLLANRLYGGLEQARAVEDLIAENVRKKAWLIFYTHDVRPSPSEYGCTPDLFEFAVARAAASGSRILTVQKALAAAGSGTPGAEMESPRKSASAQR